MNKLELINMTIRRGEYKSYLEIGVGGRAFNFKSVVIDHKDGVDPDCGGTHNMTSEEFFAENKRKYDLIFIDGDHHAEQVFKDIQNAKECLTKNGTIFVHDLDPDSEQCQAQEHGVAPWQGDGWKAWALEMCSIKPKQWWMGFLEIQPIGMGFMRNTFKENRNNRLQLSCSFKSDYAIFEKNRAKILNPVTLSDFVKDIEGNL